MTDQERSRTHRWADPMALADRTRGMSGAEFFSAWNSGDVTPPIAGLIGFDIVDHGEGFVEVACQPAEYHYNPYGTVHGGLAATLLDTATGCAVHTRLPAGTGYATVDLHVTYLRPLGAGATTVRARGQVVSLGSRVAVAQGELFDGDERLVARATSTCLILRPEAS